MHSKANEQGLWDLPNVIAKPNANLKSDQVLRYEITFKYEKETKKIIYMVDYDDNPTVAVAIDEIQKMIKPTIDEIDETYAKP